MWYYLTRVINPDDSSGVRNLGGIDSRKIGNYIRFINHDENVNCDPKQVLYKV
jgi:hypothetical protein